MASPGYTSTTTLGDSLPVFIAPAKLKMKQVGVTSKRVSQVTLQRGRGLTYREPQWASLAVISMGESDDLAQGQQMTDDLVSISVSRAGGQVIITELARDALSEPIARHAGSMLGNAYRNKVDSDLTALFPSFTVALGGAGTVVAPGRIAASVSRLHNATRPIEGEISVVLHPYHHHVVREDLLSISNGRWTQNTGTPSIDVSRGSSITGMTETLWKNFWLTRLDGADVFHDPTIATDGSDDAYSAVYAREGIILVNYKSPSMRPDEDASSGALELNFIGAYGTGIREGSWGFAIYGDASVPTT